MVTNKILNQRTVDSWSGLALKLYDLKGLVCNLPISNNSSCHSGYGSSITNPRDPIEKYVNSILKDLPEYAKELRIRNSLNLEKVEIYIEDFIKILKNLILLSQNNLIDTLSKISRILREYKGKYVKEEEVSEYLYGKDVPFAFKLIKEIHRKVFEKLEEISKEKLGDYINFLLSLFTDFDHLWKEMSEEKLLPLSKCVLEIADYIYLNHRNLPNLYDFTSFILEALSKIKITNPRTTSKRIIEILKKCEDLNTSCIEKNLSQEIYQ